MRKDSYWRVLYYYFPPLLAMSAVFYLSTSTTIKPVVKIQHFDKWNHLIAYATIGLLWVRCLELTLPIKKAIKWTIVVVAIFGIIVEICQIYCQRHFEFADILANILGCIIGCYLWVKIGKKFLSSNFLK